MPSRPPPPSHDTGRQAVDHLVSLGHRSIAFVDGGATPRAQDRQSGYRAAMAGHGLISRIRVVPGGYTEDEGGGAAQLLAGHC